MQVVVNLEEDSSVFGLSKSVFGKLVSEFKSVDFHWNKDKRDFFKEVNKADVVWGWRITPEMLKLSTKLSWFHCQAVGMRRSIFPELIDRRITVTNARGVPSRSMAEHALSLILAFTRRLPQILEHQVGRRWAHNNFASEWRRMRELSQLTFGLVGVGTVARELAKLLKVFDARILGYRLRKENCDFVDELYLGEDFEKMLGRCDCVINTLPATDTTRCFFGSRAFSSMKEGAIFLNLGRGWTVDESSLIRALGWNEKENKWENGWLGAAGLDVFEKEPLQSSSPLWSAPNVIISPHISAVSPLYWERATRLFSENLSRFLRGEELINLVNLELGY